MASLTCAFRYGREDLDVLGLTFRKELHSGNRTPILPLIAIKVSNKPEIITDETLTSSLRIYILSVWIDREATSLPTD